MMQIVRGEMVAAQARRQSRQRQNHLDKSSSVESLMPRAQWMLDTSPYATKEEADRIWRQGTRTLFGDVPPLSPSSFTGGNTLKVLAEVYHPESGTQEAKVALDTMPDVTTCLRDFLSDIHPILPDTVSGCGGLANFTEEGTLTIYSPSQKQTISLPALVATAYQLPLDCIALLGVSALLDLDVAVDQHLNLPQFSPLECHLGEKRLREWLVHHPAESIDTAPFDLDHILINPKLSACQIAQVKTVLRTFARVFEGHENCW
jgi:hypothetical protein